MITMNEYLNMCLDAKCEYFALQEQLKDSFGTNYEDLNLNINSFLEYNNYIKESLKQYNSDQVIKKLKEHFDFKVIAGNSDLGQKKYYFEIQLDSKLDFYRMLDNKKFKDILKFYNFYITQYNIQNQIICIEPIQSDNMNDIVYNKNKGIIYHFIFEKQDKSKQILNSIIEKGIRCKTAEYRHYPKKIYFYATSKRYDNLLNDVNSIFLFLKEIAKDNENNLKTIIENSQIVKVDLNRVYLKHTIDFYQDSAMKCQNAVFAFHNIPSACITPLKETFIDKLRTKLLEIFKKSN